MPRVRVIHWKTAEAEPLLEALRKAGVSPEFDDCSNTPELGRRIRLNPPDAIVIDLSRLPSQGRAVAHWLRSSKALREVPIVFANGAEEKIAKVREIMPDAVCVSNSGLKSALAKAMRGGRPPAPVVLPHKERTTPQKLGIDRGGTVGVVDPPRGYLAALGEVPDDAEIIEDPEVPVDTMLWFIHDPEELLRVLRRMWTVAGRSRLWIIWRKGSKNGLTQLSIRDTAREAGLVDYKICSVSREWSGMLFARKK
jgi:CheY-like chemotaxis protein